MQMTWQKRRAPSCSRMERKTLMRRGKRFAKRRERYETAEAATRDLKSDSIQDLLAVKRLVKILDRNRLVSRFAAHLASPHSVRINRFSASSSDLFHAFRECERGEAIRPNEKVRVLIDLAGGTRNVI